MLAGRRAFQGQSTLTQWPRTRSRGTEASPRIRKDVPNDLELIVKRCLQKRPEERYASMSEIERDLQDSALSSGVISGINLRALFLQTKRPRVAIPLLLALLILGSFVAWWLQLSSSVRWARDQALPQIAQLIGKGELGEAYALATRVELYIPKDPQLAKFWSSISWSGPINTTPPGGGGVP